MKIRHEGHCVLVITIDTEVDRSTTWRTSNPATFRSVTEGIAQRLQPLFNRYGAKPTYLVSPEVLQDDVSANVLELLEGAYELGAHLHGEFIEPEKKYQDYSGVSTLDFPCDYIETLEYAKLSELTRLFYERFGFKPVSYRAGRFGASKNTIRSLEKLGYKVDTSVTPHVCWDGRIDFTAAPEYPYFPSEDSITRKGNSGVLEIPVTIISYPGLVRLGGRVMCKLPLSKLSGLGTRLARQLWLRPSFSTAKQMVHVIERYCTKHTRRSPITLNMMFHNTEVIPSCSPYTVNESDCAVFLERIEKVLKYCTENHIRFATLNEVSLMFR
jgi:hypothetical protein